MDQQHLRDVRAELLKYGASFASVGRDLGLSRGYVREVVLGVRSNEDVWKRIAALIGHDPRKPPAGGTTPPAA